MGLLGMGRLARGLSTAVRIGAQYSRHGGGYFNPEEWESSYPEILDDATYKAGNPGQDTILNEYWLDAAEEFCQNYDDYNEGFSRDDFINYINDNIGDDKYEAVSEITDEASWELEQAYSEAGGSTGNFGYRLFAQKAGAEMKASLIFGADASYSKEVSRINKSDMAIGRLMLMTYKSSAFNNAFRSALGNKEAMKQVIKRTKSGEFGSYPTVSEARAHAIEGAKDRKYKAYKQADAVAKARAAVY